MRQSSKYSLLILMISGAFFVPVSASSATAGTPKSRSGTRGVTELAAPSARQSLETVMRGVAAVGIADGRFVALGAESASKGTAVAGPFKGDGATRESVFGKLTEQARHPVFTEPKGERGSLSFVPAPLAYAWRAVDLRTATRPVFFDGETLTMHEVDPKSLASVVQRSIPWDLLRPPRDRGGEATARETERLRVDFKQAFRARTGVKAAGLAPIPDEWVTHGGSKSRYYLMALHLTKFPLVLLECAEDQPSSCLVSRHCRMDGANDLTPADMAGIAVRPSDRLVLIGDRKKHRLLSFKFHSCLHVARRSDRALPGKIKDLSNVFVDADERLWVTTSRPDDYLNASLFYWKAGEW